MNGTLANIGLVVLFVLVGSVFAAAEISLVSLRDSQARALATRGQRGRIVAELNQDPNRFLAAVQVGVTLAGFLSAAFGGATLSGDLVPVLSGWGVPAGVGRPARPRAGHGARSPTSPWCSASWPPSGSRLQRAEAVRAGRRARRSTGSPGSPGR